MTEPSRKFNSCMTWHPFHAYLRGKHNDPITVGLTSKQADKVMDMLEVLANAIPNATKRHQNAYDSCFKIMKRRNLRALPHNESGEIKVKEKK